MRKVYVIIGKDQQVKYVIGVYSSLKKARIEMAYFKAHLKDQEFFIETHILL